MRERLHVVRCVQSVHCEESETNQPIKHVRLDRGNGEITGDTHKMSVNKVPKDFV